MKIGINGFGRIGRTIARINAIKERFDLAAINDINPFVDNMAYLLKYDSVYGKFPLKVAHGPDELRIDNKRVPYFSCTQLIDVPWRQLGCDVVIDASGVEHNAEITHELPHVIVTHSSPAADYEIILGINDEGLCPEHKVVSNSICDANALAHPLKWIDEAFGIDVGAVTTLHPWLSYQNLVDGIPVSQSRPGIPWSDYALGRASGNNVIPKDTTAVQAVERVLPDLKGKLISFSYRIPTAVVASSDVTIKTRTPASVEDLCALFQTQATASSYVRTNSESLVSVDYQREEASCVIDLQWLKVRNDLVKFVLWYDNEWGYSNRVLDLAQLLCQLTKPFAQATAEIAKI